MEAKFKSQISILIVDDDAIDRQACARQLRKNGGFKIFEAETGSQCIKLCKEFKYDCILLDYTLPDIDGINLLHALQELLGNNIAPVIMLTGNGSEEIALQALKKGANDYLSKNNDAYNNLSHFIVNAIENSNLNKQIVKMAKFDSLTELLNRGYFEEVLEMEFFKAKKKGLKIAVLFIDLDDFKNVNDTQGHLAGDVLLCGVAERIKNTIRAGDLIARLGGDEFAILLNNIKDDAEAVFVANKIIDILKVPFKYEKEKIYVGCSIGIAYLSPECTSAIELINQADQAMYRAKKSGKNNYQFFDKTFSKEVIENINIASALRESLLNEELIFHYQPIFSLSKNKIVAIESLLRWNNEKYSHIGPEKFIPLIEETHLMLVLGRWIVSENIKQFSKILMDSDEEVMLNVNLSPKQLSDDELIGNLVDSLTRYEVNPSSIEFEITETAVLGYEDSVRTNMQNIANLSVKTGLDDFGTGFASFSHLRDFPLNTLKLDKSFVENIGKDSKNESLIRAIIYTAKEMDLNLIAEGVETQLQKEFLVKHDCDLMQGFYFSKPLSAQETIQLINTHNKSTGGL